MNDNKVGLAVVVYIVILNIEQWQAEITEWKTCHKFFFSLSIKNQITEKKLNQLCQTWSIQ
jgi:hypothetical protein